MSTLFPGKEEDSGPTLEAAGGRVTLQVGRCFVLTIHYLSTISGTTSHFD